MAGIYIHIPFCRQACGYCDFHFSTQLKYKEPFLNALQQEVELRKNFFDGPLSLSTLYFGGGTPSLLEESELQRLLDLLHERFHFQSDLEFTLEANPDDLTAAKIAAFRRAGVNRLSIGIQSFRDEDLLLMNRTHNSEQAIAAVKRAQDAGITNLTVDLIYGIPDSTERSWRKQLDIFASLELRHLSAYALTVEKGTLLANQVEKEKVIMPDDQLVFDQFAALVAFAQERGMEHYEISNFAFPGFQSKHNSSYWAGEPYLGLGPSAHSFIPHRRSWNVSNNQDYIRMLGEGKSPEKESEVLTIKDQMNEYLMTGLRLAKGIDLTKMSREFGRELLDEKEKQIAGWMNEGLVQQEGSQLWLTTTGKFVADGIIRELFD